MEGVKMKTMIMNKFETMFNDLRALFFTNEKPNVKKPSSSQPNKIQEPGRPKQNSPQRMSSRAKKKSPSVKDKSMTDHTGETKFQGSGYKGKGNVDHGKIVSNRKRR
jgi:hypothetical protein